MTDGEHALYYSDTLMENLQYRYGAGMLSPGGEAELDRLVGTLPLAERHGLDLGCGIGGYDEALVRRHGARHVTGVDINAAAVEIAVRRAADLDLENRLSYKAVEPGPLPFPDGAFDFAVSKDAIVDMPDKAPVLAELHRVLRPGGTLLLSDWFRAEAPMTPEMREWATEGEETYEMASLASTSLELAKAGFADIETEDRSDWFRAFCRDERDRLAGPLFETYVARFGEESARRSVRNAETRLLLAEQGQLLVGHIRARKPV